MKFIGVSYEESACSLKMCGNGVSRVCYFLEVQWHYAVLVMNFAKNEISVPVKYK